jgi:LysR family transcriptional regulator, transcriptional activator of the cysJI operon
MAPNPRRRRSSPRQPAHPRQDAPAASRASPRERVDRLPAPRRVTPSRTRSSPAIPTTPANPAIPAGPANPALPRPRAAGLGRVMREVQMENVHPLRLRLLLEIDRTGSITAAAETCAIGQPSASMHLRTLETAIGENLVTRNRSGSQLTPAGKIVASHAARVLATLDSMRYGLDALEGPHREQLTLAASLTPSVALLPRILRQYSHHYPHVNITLKTLPSEAVAQQIARAQADIGIAGEAPTTQSQSIIRTQILVDELIGISPSGLPPFDSGRVNPSQLAPHTLLIGAPGSSTRTITERYLTHANYQPERIWVFDSYQAIKQAVTDGLGISFISRLLVHDELQREQLNAFRITGIGPMLRRIHLLQPATTQPTPQTRALTKLLTHTTPPTTKQPERTTTGTPTST